MSIFKTSGIILKKNKIQENKEILTIFCENYWKLNLEYKKSKKEKELDLWYIINFEINVKKENSLSEVKNVKIKNEFNYSKYSFEIIFEYLEFLKVVEELAPFNMEIKEIFNILESINKYENLTLEKLIFSKAKIISIFWILKDSKNPKIQKILNFIWNNKIDDILKLYWLNQEELNILKESLSF